MQIIGTLKCRDTKKCRLWFEQRGVKYHFVDLTKRALSEGELEAVAAGGYWEDLIDRDGTVWNKRLLAWKDYDPRVELREEPGLLKTPIVREGRDVVIGYNEQGWERIRRLAAP